MVVMEAKSHRVGLVRVVGYLVVYLVCLNVTGKIEPLYLRRARNSGMAGTQCVPQAKIKYKVRYPCAMHCG